MSDLFPIYVYPTYDGVTDTTTWHGYVLTPEVRYAAHGATLNAVVNQLQRVVRRTTADVGPVQVIARHWRKGQTCDTFVRVP